MLNPITYTEDVVRDFLRYQLTTYPFADQRLHDQMRLLLSLDETRKSPLLRGPYVSLSRAFRQGAAVSQLVEEGVLHPHMENLIPYPHVYGHQETAIRAVCDRRSTLVSTGTGSGKTETFLYPIISRCLELRDRNAPASITAVLIYPMNALAEDQLERLRELLVGTGVTFGMYVGKTPEQRGSVLGERLPAGTTRAVYQQRRGQPKGRDSKAVHPFEERASREEIRESPPRILLTNVKQLELLLTRQRDVQMFENARLEYLVFDEAHTFSGANGAETACLIRRLRAFCGKSPADTVCIGTSATIADTERGVEAGRDFAARFFGVDGEPVALVGEEYEDEVWSGDRSPSPPLPGNPPSKALQYVLEALGRVDVDDPSAEDVREFRKTFELLTGATLGKNEDWREVLHDWLSHNEVVFQIGEALKGGARPLFELPETLRKVLGREVAVEEVLTWLSLGAAARREGRPLLRPVVHGFIRGIQGAVVTFPDEADGPRLWLSQEEATDEGDELERFEVLTCTTCGQHYFGHNLLDFELIGKAPDGGNALGDSFYWDSAQEGDGTRVVLVDRLIFDESDEEDENVLDDSKKVAPLHVCRFCGTAHPTGGDRCVGCGRQDARVQLYAVRTKEGRDAALTSCLACGSPGRRRYGRYREPARPVKATNVADVHVLSQSMLEHAERKRLLVFADNRQDAAFQAGWMQDHARRYRLRALMYECIERNNELSIGDLVFMLDEELDNDDNLSRTLLPEVWREVRKSKAGLKHAELRRKFLHFQVFREITNSPRQRIGLEPWGRIRIDYQGLDPEHDFFGDWASEIGTTPELLHDGVCTLLDQHRRTGLILDREFQMYTRMWTEGDREIQRGYLPQMLLFGFPKGLKLERDPADNKNRISQWISSRGLTLPRDAAKKWGVDDERVGAFLRELWEVVTDAQVIVPVTLQGPRKPLSHVDGAHQIDGDNIVIRVPDDGGVYRCNVCRKSYTRPSPNSACIAYRCSGEIQWEPEDEDDYDLLVLDQGFQMVRPEEHSAQIPGDRREILERAFKGDSEFVNTLVCTPTLELGVDIGALDSVLMRNVPPSPANYWQRAGRAGRRHRMAVNFTYARPASHDRSYFRDPLLMLDGLIRPPRFNLKNELMVRKHAHATMLSILHRMARDEGLTEPEVEPVGLSTLSEASASSTEKAEIREALQRAFPDHVKGYLYRETGEIRHDRFEAILIAKVLKKHEEILVHELESVFSQGWPEADAELVTTERLRSYVREMAGELEKVVARLYRRRDWAISQVQRLNEVFNRQGALTPEEEWTRRRCNALLQKLKGINYRSRADAEGYDDTYTYAVLAAEGFLPGYGLDTGTVLATYEASDSGSSQRDWAIRRGTALALREYVPGALIYAGGNKYFPRKYQMATDDSALFAVDASSQAVQEVGSPSHQALAALGATGLAAYPICDVQLPHQSNISDDEDYRFQLPSAVFGYEQDNHRGGLAYAWGTRDLQFRRSVHMRQVNVGPLTHVNDQNLGYPVCPVCGDSRSPYSSKRELEDFQQLHAQRCGRAPGRIGFYADVVADALRFDACRDRNEAYSLAEALRNGASLTLEMELDDLQALAIGQMGQQAVDLLLYDPMPGGSGLIEQLIERWDEVIERALEFVEGCPAQCEAACSECLMDYRNAYYHRYLDRHQAAELLSSLGGLIEETHAIPPQMPGASDTGPGPTNVAEARLAAILERAGFTDYETQKEIDLSHPLGRTFPDFYFEDPNDIFDGICIYLDGLSEHIHGNPATAERDANIRDQLRNENYDVHELPASYLFDETAIRDFLYRLGRRLADRDRARELKADSSIYYGDFLPDEETTEAPEKDSEWNEYFDRVDDGWIDVVKRLRDEHLPAPFDVHSPLMVDGRTSAHESVVVWEKPIGRVALVQPEVADALGEADDDLVVIGRGAWLDELKETLGVTE